MMKSLKRNSGSDSRHHRDSIASKVYVRSTKNGKVQKIVSEIYLRRDIPCSSRLCSKCPATAPADANGKSTQQEALNIVIHILQDANRRLKYPNRYCPSALLGPKHFLVAIT
jgi:hypothetical protein